jgi:alkaline phosphatase
MPNPKNVIVFIGDGMGFNQVLAANYYLHGQAEAQPYEQADWTRLSSATYAAVTRVSDTDTVFGVGYNPRLAWLDADYVNEGATGSAESATALSTGIKTYSPSIGIGVMGDTLTHISQAAKALGKSAGVVSSVQLSHATPAGFAAHNQARSNLSEIARYLFFHTRLDLIMAAGNPDYDNNGVLTESSDRFVGGREIWEQLTANDGRTHFLFEGDTLVVQDIDGDGQLDPWTLVQEREDFVALAEGETPRRVLGVPMVNTTLHYGRDGSETEMPFVVPKNENVPALEELTRASLNVLAQNPNGFFVMIEGGAIDWAGHDNHLGRNIEEVSDFNQAVRAAIEWVEENSSWDETLIIITADHETGYLAGPDHPEKVNSPVVNQGQGALPLVRWNSDGHTNQLVPFYAKGKGAALFKLFADERDPVRGPYIQHSELAQALFLMWGKPDNE